MNNNKLIGGVLLAIGAAVVFFGIMRLNSFESQLAGFFDKTDYTAIGAIIVGGVAALGGIVALAKKTPGSPSTN